MCFLKSTIFSVKFYTPYCSLKMLQRSVPLRVLFLALELETLHLAFLHETFAHCIVGIRFSDASHDGFDSALLLVYPKKQMIYRGMHVLPYN